MASSARSIWTLIGVETMCFLGSEISRYGIAVWIFDVTGSVTAFSLLLAANVVPGMLARPIAGSIVDRSSRKLVMIGASVVSLCGTMIVLGGALLGELSMPLVLAGASLASVGEAFQWPALSATIPLMASEEDLPRYNGFLESGRAAGRFAGPPIGAFFFGTVGVTGLVSIELATFTLAAIVVSLLQLPQPDEEPPEAESLVDELSFGTRWIWAHKPLFKFMLVATFANFLLGIGEVVMQPYGLGALGRDGFGIASGLFGAGMIVGGIVTGALSRRLTSTQQFLWSALFVGALYVTYGLSRDVVALGAMNFAIATMMTIGNASIMTIWQTKVPAELQGRVLSAMMMAVDITTPLAFLAGAPAAVAIAHWLFGHSNAASVWGGSETGELGGLFSALGALQFVLFTAVAFMRDIRRVEDLAVE